LRQAIISITIGVVAGYIFKFFLFVLLCVSYAKAQIPVGLKESSLGNSGVAISDSSAPSYYNPALLSERHKSYFSLTGTTLTSFKSSKNTEEFRSTKFAPNYISSIQAFDSFIHEFSLANQLSVDSSVITPVTDGSKTTNIRSDQYSLAYAFAFRNFPFGFQVGLRVNENNINLKQSTNDGNIATGVDFDISQRVADMFVGFGGIHQLGTHYRFGYKYESPGLNFYKKSDRGGSYYIYNKTDNTFTTGQTQGSLTETNLNSQVITIGHSFIVNDHEFLTDSRFLEQQGSKNSYDFYQTFGYKINFSNKMQYMCGFSQKFSDSPEAFDSNYFSTGFSWQTSSLRSTLSGYYADGKDDTQSAGITFGSEFTY
jgi:hypothetical protein